MWPVFSLYQYTINWIYVYLGAEPNQPLLFEQNLSVYRTVPYRTVLQELRRRRRQPQGGVKLFGVSCRWVISAVCSLLAYAFQRASAWNECSISAADEWFRESHDLPFMMSFEYDRRFTCKFYQGPFIVCLDTAEPTTSD